MVEERGRGGLGGEEGGERGVEEGGGGRGRSVFAAAVVVAEAVETLHACRAAPRNTGTQKTI